MKLAITEISSGEITFALGAWDVTAELRGSAQALRITNDEGTQVEARALSLERVRAQHGVRRLEATRVSLDGALHIVEGELTLEVSRALFERLSYRDPMQRVDVERLELAEGASFAAGALALPLIVARGVELVRGNGEEELRVELEAATGSDFCLSETLAIASSRLEGVRIVRGAQEFSFGRADVMAFAREQAQVFGVHTLQLDELLWKEGDRTLDARRVAVRDALLDLEGSRLHFVAASSRDAKLRSEGLEVALEKLELPQGGQAAHPSGLVAAQARFEGFKLLWLVAGEGPAASMLSALLASELAESSASEGKEVELEDEALRGLADRLSEDGVDLSLGGWSLGAAGASIQTSQQLASRLLLEGRAPRRFELELGGAKLADLALKPSTPMA